MNPLRQQFIEASGGDPGRMAELWDLMMERVYWIFTADRWKKRGQFPTHDRHIPYEVKIRHLARAAAAQVRSTA